MDKEKLQKWQKLFEIITDTDAIFQNFKTTFTVTWMHGWMFIGSDSQKTKIEINDEEAEIIKDIVLSTIKRELDKLKSEFDEL